MLDLAMFAAEAASAVAEQHEAPTALLLTPGGWVAASMVFVFGIMLYAKVPAIIAAALDKKIDGIKEQLDAASRLRAEAEALKSEYEKKVRSAAKDAEALKAAAEDEAKLIVAKAKADDEKKLATRSLGSKPVVLVPPAKKATTSTKKPKLQSNAVEETVVATTDGGGLYGGTDLTTANTDAAPAVPATTPKKKKTLADLFRGDEAATEAAPADVAAAPVSKPKAIVPAQPAVKKPQAAAPEQQASLGGFGVQLASFRSRNEATAEFSRLKAKHSATLGGFNPIISEAQVGGSTRYRLSVGGMSNQAEANAVCSKLFAGGERDCLVKRQ